MSKLSELQQAGVSTGGTQRDLRKHMHKGAIRYGGVKRQQASTKHIETRYNFRLTDKGKKARPNY